MLKQLMKYMTKNGLQEKMQSSYKIGHSTETALLQIQNDLLLNLADKQGVILVLLDLSAAFDTIDHDILLHRLESLLGISSTPLAWFASYLRDRSHAVSINNCTSPSTKTTFGVPQGSVLGPILFTIYTMPLSSIIESYGLKFHFYADDTQIYLNFSAQQQLSFDECLSQVENCIVAIKSWMTQNLLKLNDEQTEILFITSPYYQKRLIFREVLVDKTAVKSSNSARNIGVMFDNNMDMKDHISNVCKKCNFGLRNIGQIRKYLTLDSCATLVHSLITSRIDYCNSLLGNLPVSSTKPLQRLHNTAARIVSLKPKFDHITPVLKALHWLPVRQRIVFKILLFVFQCIHDSAPEYLSSLITINQPQYSTRHSLHRSLSYNTPHSGYASRAFSIYGPTLFNALPTTLRDINNFNIFKQHLKTFLFKEAFDKSESDSIFKN